MGENNSKPEVYERSTIDTIIEGGQNFAKGLVSLAQGKGLHKIPKDVYHVSQKEVPDEFPKLGSSWIKQLSDDTRLNEIAIPGTHDSGAMFGGIASECHSWTILIQLKVGIRFFDMRCRHIDDRFAIHHGFVFQNIYLEDVISQCKEFLNENPHETIILRVKEEYRSKGCTRSFAETFEKRYWDENIFFTDRTKPFPTLKDIRGKIVLVPLGFKFAKTAIKYWTHFVVQNEFDIVGEKRKELIQYHYASSVKRSYGKDFYYINFIAGNKMGVVVSPIEHAIEMNSLVLEFDSKYCGIIMFDFPSEKVVEYLYNLNFL